MLMFGVHFDTSSNIAKVGGGDDVLHTSILIPSLAPALMLPATIVVVALRRCPANAGLLFTPVACRSIRSAYIQTYKCICVGS